MATKRTDLTWSEIDLHTLPTKLKDSFDMYREAQDAANEFKAVFNTDLTKTLQDKGKVPKNMDVLVGHRWGKVSVAVTKADPTRPGPVTKISLA